MTRATACLRPGCPGAALARGLCRACYAAAWRLVKRGRAAWRDLEAAGKCGASRRGTRAEFFTKGKS